MTVSVQNQALLLFKWLGHVQKSLLYIVFYILYFQHIFQSGWQWSDSTDIFPIFSKILISSQYVCFAEDLESQNHFHFLFSFQCWNILFHWKLKKIIWHPNNITIFIFIYLFKFWQYWSQIIWCLKMFWIPGKCSHFQFLFKVGMNTSSQNVNSATTQCDPFPKTYRADKQ